MPCPRGARTFGLAAIALLLAAYPGTRMSARAQAPQQPVFKSGVELITVDVAIVDKTGAPIPSLNRDQFDVAIDGKPRRVVSAEFLEFTAHGKPGAVPVEAIPEAQPAFSSNEEPAPASSRGRLIFLAVDQGSFQSFGARGAMEAARRFIDRLQPEDRVGLVAFPPPGPNLAATRDHAAIRAATAQIMGTATPLRIGGIDKNLGLAEAIDIHAGDTMAFEKVMARECSYARTAADRMACEIEIKNTADSIGRNADVQATNSLGGLEDIFTSLARIRERKTLVLVSAGLPVADRIGQDLQYTSTVSALGRQAAAANLNFFVLHIDSGFLDAYSASERTVSDTLSRDMSIMSSGLDSIAGSSGGSLARVVSGADFAFDRVLRETSAAYLLGVEALEADRDGKPHRISVKVKVPNAEVRSRREVVIPKASTRPATPDEALAAAFGTGRQETGLPIRLTTNSLAATGREYRVLVSADIGNAFTGPTEMRLLYAFTDASGRAVAPFNEKPTLRPRPGGPPGSVSFTSDNTLQAGTYTIRLAVAEPGGRIGTVDHAFSVGMTKGDTVRMSDLLLMEPRLQQHEMIAVLTDSRLRGAAVDAYLEVAPAGSAAKVTAVAFGIAERPDGEPLVSVTSPAVRTGSAGYWTAGARLNVTLLPPGDYVATAAVLADTRTLGRVTRPIRIERAAGAAGGADAASGPRVSFAAGETGSLVKPFSRRDVLGRDTLEYFLGRMRSASPEAASDPSADAASAAILESKFDQALASLVPADPALLSTAFLKGLALFGQGELNPAMAQFRVALAAAPDFLPAAFYLGACYAAGGKDGDAVGAWQTALITESDARIVYDVLGDALLRMRDGDEAAILLTEARDKWTDDDRFVPRLAASEALRSHPREALALLDGYIDRHPADADALLLALRILYDARSAGRRVTTAADDAAAARRYADLYKAAGGGNLALVSRWLIFIAGK
jgi:VWFA-related protein